MAYYLYWDGEQHLTAFGKYLNDDQVRIDMASQSPMRINSYFISSKFMP
jgi:hypothetical protein